MPVKQLLQEAEADFAALAGLPAEIRDIARQGLADLTQIRDDIKGAVATLTTAAGAHLTALQALAADRPADPLVPGDADTPSTLSQVSTTG